MGRKHLLRTATCILGLMVAVGCSDDGASRQPTQTSTTVSVSATRTSNQSASEPAPSVRQTTMKTSPAPGDNCPQTRGWNTEADVESPELLDREIPNRPLLGDHMGILWSKDGCSETLQFNFASPRKVGFTFSYQGDALVGSFFAPTDPPQDLREYEHGFGAPEWVVLRHLKCGYFEGYVDCTITVDHKVPFAVEHQPRKVGGPLDIVTISFALTR